MEPHWIPPMEKCGQASSKHSLSCPFHGWRVSWGLGSTGTSCCSMPGSSPLHRCCWTKIIFSHYFEVLQASPTKGALKVCTSPGSTTLFPSQSQKIQTSVPYAKVFVLMCIALHLPTQNLLKAFGIQLYNVYQVHFLKDSLAVSRRHRELFYISPPSLVRNV